MQVILKKQPEKYLSKCPQNTHEKLNGALIGLENWEGDIKKLQGRKDEYRLKLPPFRIIFIYVNGEDIITVTRIDTRGQVYKRG